METHTRSSKGGVIPDFKTRANAWSLKVRAEIEKTCFRRQNQHGFTSDSLLTNSDRTPDYQRTVSELRRSASWPSKYARSFWDNRRYRTLILSPSEAFPKDDGSPVMCSLNTRFELRLVAREVKSLFVIQLCSQSRILKTVANRTNVVVSHFFKYVFASFNLSNFVKCLNK